MMNSSSISAYRLEARSQSRVLLHSLIMRQSNLLCFSKLQQKVTCECMFVNEIDRLASTVGLSWQCPSQRYVVTGSASGCKLTASACEQSERTFLNGAAAFGGIVAL
jgi:hypothetical protein